MSANYGVFGALQNGKGNEQRQRTATTSAAGGSGGSVEAHNSRSPYYMLVFR